jgi:Ca-activated chloride channel family protein
MRMFITITIAFLLGLSPVVSFGQGLLLDSRPDHGFRLPRPYPWPYPHPHPIPQPRPLPQPPQAYKIKQLAVDVNLTDQIAKVQVSQSFVNTGSRQMEVRFLFPLPYDGAVDRMTFLVDGKEYEAKLLNAGEARRIFEDYVRRAQDPALLEWMGNGMFQTSVFPVPPGAERRVMLRFSQVCRKTNGLTELMFPLSTAKYTSAPVEEVKLDVTVQSQAPIKNVYSPTHAIAVQRPSENSARITFRSQNEIPTDDFRLLYDVGEAAVGASTLSYRRDSSDEGYFMLLVSPEIKQVSDQPLKKTVIFVVDRSGSMSGKKIEQAKGALTFVLNNLREGDLFNIVAYDNEVESFRPELQRYDESSRQQAIGFIEGIYAGGSTNIDEALQVALRQLQDDSRPNYVVFLTDGLPTAGETNEVKIVDHARQQNGAHARVFSMGVGYDVNSRLLDKLARTLRGRSEYVRPNEDIETYVSRLYERIEAPVMTDVAITIDVEGFPPDRGSAVSRLYPKDTYDLFAGDQLVIVGRYKQGGAAKVKIRGQVAGQTQEFDFPATLATESSDSTYAFVEKLWAMRRVGEIVDQIDLEGKNQELIDELVALSTKHGILTPYTSYLADDATNPRNFAVNRTLTEERLDLLQSTAGRGAFEQRRAKSYYQYSDQVESAGFARQPLNLSAQPATAPGAGAQPAITTGGLATDGLQVIESEAARVVQTVQNVGSKTFFLRNGRWVDSTLSEEQEQHAIQLARYSTEYFDLISQYGRDVAKYLAIEGEVTVVLNGQAYSF